MLRLQRFVVLVGHTGSGRRRFTSHPLRAGIPPKLTYAVVYIISIYYVDLTGLPVNLAHQEVVCTTFRWYYLRPFRGVLR